MSAARPGRSHRNEVNGLVSLDEFIHPNRCGVSTWRDVIECGARPDDLEDKDEAIALLEAIERGAKQALIWQREQPDRAAIIAEIHNETAYGFARRARALLKMSWSCL